LLELEDPASRPLRSPRAVRGALDFEALDDAEEASEESEREPPDPVVSA
jgi:hypothetical protein